jgi:hypothetical protein
MAKVSKTKAQSKATETPEHKQIDWVHQLLLLSDEASDCSSDDRIVRARDLLYVAATQLKSLGEAKGDDTLLLIARVCEGLEDAIGTVRVPQLIADYAAHGFEPPPALTTSEVGALNTALRQSSNAIEKASRSELRGVKVPTTKERASAAIQCRDNIANFITLGPTRSATPDSKPDDLLDARAELAENTVAMSIGVGFGSRFLLNTNGRTLSERRQLWLNESKCELLRSTLTSEDGRRKAATAIVKRCAVIDGMSQEHAQNLFISERRQKY